MTQTFYQQQVARLCDADQRATHRPTAYVASVVSVHALAATHAHHQARRERWLRRYVLQLLRRQAVTG
jgi:cytochrome b561